MLKLSCGFEECNAMRIVEPTDAIKVKLSTLNLQDFIPIDLKPKASL